MPRFNVKHIEVPLFGVVEHSNQSDWRKAFASGHAMTMDIDSDAIDLVAEELALDVEGIANDAARYVEGKFREKAQGLSGSALGDFGEIVAYLFHRTRRRAIVRVVAWKRGDGHSKGERFPMPDFIFEDRNGQLAALEVKSTEAFDFLFLRDRVKKWKLLRPCRSVAACREAALPQLGHVDAKFARMKHKVVAKDGRVVPFPVGAGIATAMLAVDGRTASLRGIARYRTPSDCTALGRTCWSCVPETVGLLLVDMHNEPGRLSLAGGSGGGSAWLSAYRRWGEAIESRELSAVRATTSTLVERTSIALSDAMSTDKEVLLAFWGSYLHDTMAERGLSFDVATNWGNLARDDLRFTWQPMPLGSPASRYAAPDGLTDLLRAEVEPRPFSITLSRRKNAPRHDHRETLAVRADDNLVEFHLMSDVWWRDRRVESDDEAGAIAARLVARALEALGWRSSILKSERAVVKPLAARVGDRSIVLAWVLADEGPLHAWRETIIQTSSGPPSPHWPRWFGALLDRDPRVAIRVFPDGRATLGMPRSHATQQP